MPYDFKDIKSYANFLYKLSPNEITILSSLIGLTLCQSLNGYEASSLGNFFELIGQTLLTYGAQAQLFEEIND